MSRKLLSVQQRAVKPTDYIAILEALANITTSEKANRKWQLYFRVLWETGIRPGEALGIVASDVGSGFLKVRRLKKKGHPEDEVKIQPVLELALKSYIASARLKPKDRLFPTTIQSVHFIFNQVKHKLCLPEYITPHSFRHGFAMNFKEQAPPELKADALKLLTLLQRALAHENISSTSVYIQSDKSEVDKLIEEMRF